MILTQGGSADTGQATIARGSPSLEEEDGGTKVLGKPTEVPAPKAHVPSEEELRPLAQRDRLAATARVPTLETFLPSKQVPLGQVPFEEMPSVQRSLENIPTAKGREDKDRNAGTRVPSAEGVNELPLAEPEWEDLVRPTGVSFPTPLEMLAGHGVEAAA